MWKVTLRDIRAHFGRFIMTMLAAAIGVAFLCGTLSLRDLMTSTFSSITASAITDDVYIQGEQQISSASYLGFNPIAEADLAKVQGLNGVKKAYPIRQTEAYIYNEAGEAANIAQAPALGFQYQSELVSGYGADSSDIPPAPKRDEVLIEQSTATRAGLSVGDKVTVVIDTPRTMRVSAIVEYGTSAAGAAISMYNPEQFIELAGDGIMQIGVTAEDGVSSEELKKRIEQALPDTYTVQTAQEMEELTDEIVDLVLSLVNTFLLVFVAIALAISTFIITNTFTISIKQRQKQFALLRAVGASPRQIFATVLIQSIVIGIIGAGLGVILGQALLVLINVGLEYAGMPLSGAPTVTAHTAGISFAVGLLVTVVATILPSYRASLIPPIEAMREGSGQSEKPLTARTILAALMLAAGITATAHGAIKAELPIFGIGVGLLFIATIGIMPGLGIPVIKALGLIARTLAPATGRIASRSLLASPRKTATTAVALAIGVALVAAGSSVAASMKATIADDIDVNFSADALLLPQKSVNNVPEIVRRVEKVTGVESVDSSLSSGFVQIVAIDGTPLEPSPAETSSTGNASSENMTSENSSSAQDVLSSFINNYSITAGEASAHALDQLGIAFEHADASVLDSGQAIISQSAAQKFELQTGSTLTLVGTAAPVEVQIGAITENSPLSFGQAEVMLPRHLTENLSPSNETRMSLIVSYEPSYKSAKEAAGVKADIQQAVKDQYVWTIMDKNDIKDVASGSINSILIVLYALLALSVVIAMMGVVNTLTLSIVDRTREIGLLRAVGMYRAGVRRIVVQESIIITLLGTMVGMALGVGIGLALTRYLAESSGSDMAYVIPWEMMGVTLVVAFIVGACASVFPARKAAHLNVLEAIAEE